LADDDLRLHSRFIQDLADRGTDNALDPKSLLLLDCRLNSSELNEVQWLDNPEHFDASTGFAARRAAKRKATRDSALSSTTTR
jgi:hypothetical protein